MGTADTSVLARASAFAAGDEVQARVALRGHQSSVTTAAFSADGRRVVTASWDSTARVWDAEKGTLLAELRGHQSSVSTAAFSADGRRVVTASGDSTARVWDAEDRKSVG